MGGWKYLSDYYKSEEQFNGKKWYFQSIKLGLVTYSNCVTIGLNETSISLSVLPIFRIGHPPLLIPLNELQGTEYKGLVFKYVDINPRKATGQNIRFLKKQADRIEEFTRNGWQYKRCS